MERSVAFALSLSITIPIIIGSVRYRNLPASYRPLLYVLLVGFANEMICYCFFYANNAIPNNIYLLAEFLLFAYQFRQWKNILRNKWAYRTVILALSSLWVVEDIVFKKITVFSPWFQVAYSFVLILLAVSQLNWLIVNERGNIIKNPIFIVCFGMILFYSYKVLTEVFYHYAPANLIKNNIFVMEAIVNVGYNLILAVAILCIPKKINFIQPSL
ncbi:MAG: hypothetical protein EOP51_13275 [Sphingobacteriales bacterium]|nr:MAG: hypothetical protein EOP51_13275 [Sphingobacteriales bacterium]